MAKVLQENLLMIQGHCYGLKCTTPLNSYVEALILNVILFGDGDFNEVTKVK